MVKGFHNADKINVVLQFVSIMDQTSMRVEWKCITMVYGVQCVMMNGI